MDLQVVLHNHYSLSLALLLQVDEEVTKPLGVVAVVEDLVVDEASLLADGAYDGDRVPSKLQSPQLHARAQPALGHSLPEVAGRLIDVDDLVEGPLLHVGHEVLHVDELVIFQAIVLGLSSPVLIIRSLELYSVSTVVTLKSREVKLWKAKLLTDDLRPLPQRQVAHALKSVKVYDPFDLLFCQDFFVTFSLCFEDEKFSKTPPIDNLELRTLLDTCHPEDFSCTVPVEFIT